MRGPIFIGGADGGPYLDGRPPRRWAFHFARLLSAVTLTRRALLSATVGACAALAGCSGGKTADDDGYGDDGVLPYEADRAGVAVERGGHFALELPTTEQRALLDYAVEARGDALFDVYVLTAEAYDTYRRSVAGETEDAPEGIPGAASERASGTASASFQLPAGTYRVVVDYSDYGGPDGADVSASDPEELVVDVSVRLGEGPILG